MSASEAEAGSQSVEVGMNRTDKGVRRVLVVEDDPVVIQIVEDILVSLGYKVTTASDAVEALARFGQCYEETRCVILDYGIPGMHVSRLLSSLREIDEEVKVLVSSGYPESFVCSDIPPGSFDAFLPKPFNPEALVRELKKLLFVPNPAEQ